MPLAPDFQTLLVLSTMGVPLYSARGVTETLRLIPQAAFLIRDINGELCDASDENFRKYQVTITGEDMDSPSSDTVYPGLDVTVDCITELAYQAGTPWRTAVSGSTRTNGTFSIYRPQLVCKVVDLEIETNEWGDVVRWTLSLEEI